MAAKNYAAFLPQAVRSVQAQTYADWELVVIDDGSSDATPDVVKPLLSDARIRYHRSDRLGQPRAKNLGLRFSRGELIAYLDADDAWRETKLERQVALMQANPRAGVCYTGRVLMDEQGRLSSAPPHPQPRSLGGEGGLTRMFLNNFVCFSSVMVRRSVFDHVGGFDPGLDLAIDYDQWLRVAKHYAFVGLDDPLVLYRTGHGNLSKKLWDRVDTALSIMTRAVYRRGLNDELPPHVIAEGYASTCCTLGYILRSSEPLTAMKWYGRALGWGGRRIEAVKGMLASGLIWMRGTATAGAAENATVNG